jgi:hypothetical protein
MVRIALTLVAAVGIAAASMPAAAVGQQTFSTMSTGKAPTPGPTASSWNGFGVYPYYAPYCGGRSGNGSSGNGNGGNYNRNCRPYTPGPQPSNRPPKTTGRTQNPPPPAKPSTAAKPPSR